MIEFGLPPKIVKPAIIRPRPARIISPGEPDYRLPGLGAAGFALTPLSGFGASAGGAVFTPASVANLKAWYRSDLGITESGGTVSAWADQSGNGHNLTEATNKPAYSATSGANSFPGLTFDGSNDKLTCTFSAMSQPFHFFAVFKTLATPSNAGIVGGAGSGERPIGIGSANNDGVYIYMGTDTNVRTPTNDHTAHYVWEFLVNGSSSRAVRAATADSTGNPGSNTLTGISLAQVPGVGFANCIITEIILYSVEISGADLTNLRAYLGTRYSLTV